MVPNNPQTTARIQLLSTLVKNHQSYDLALKTGLSFLVKNEISSGSDASFTLTTHVITLLQELVEKEQSPDKIAEAASSFLKKVNDPRKGNAGIDLFKTLICKKFSFHKATQVGVELMESEHPWKRSLGISLFKALVKEGQSYPEAAKGAKQLKNYDLLRTLVKKGHGHQEAEESVASFIRLLDQERSRFVDAMSLLIDLIASGRFFKEGEEFGLTLLASKKSLDHWWAINVFTALAAQGRGIESGLKAVESLQSLENLSLLKAALSKHLPSGES